MNYKSAIFAALAVATAATTPAAAAVTLGFVPGGAVYSGPAPTYNFDTPTPMTGGLITTGSLGGVRAQPLGSTGKYGTVGPTDGSPATLDLSSFANISSISLLWGSVDTYNTLELLNRTGGVLASFVGANVTALANGNQTSPFTNPIVTLGISGADQTNIGGLRFKSTSNAFEFDNISISSVPEPTTWAMLLLGFGIAGMSLRARSRRAGTKLSFV
jgi:hypothetical protein